MDVRAWKRSWMVSIQEDRQPWHVFMKESRGMAKKTGPFHTTETFNALVRARLRMGMLAVLTTTSLVRTCPYCFRI